MKRQINKSMYFLILKGKLIGLIPTLKVLHGLGRQAVINNKDI
jgi:hypothetical protein